MIHTNDFSPDWISPPGETIVELLDESGLSIEDLSRKIGLSSQKSQRLLDGELSICQSLASRLESTFKVSSKFWLSRDSQYQAFKQRLEAKEKSWLELLPVADMVKFGWISKRSPRNARVRECLNFFNQSSIDAWYKDYAANELSVAYRASSSFKTEPVSVFTWLQYAQIETKKTAVLPWDREILIDSIPEIRELTNEPNPQVFIPKLKRIFAEAGVVFVIAKTPTGCRASGATCFFEKNKATLVMSFRYLTDDHFWFTLFHEIGHLVLHTQEHTVRIEGRGIQGVSDIEEQEANDFASTTLIPSVYRKEMSSFYKSDWKRIVRFARKVGVSKGIVLGQLQHMGNIDYAYLNRLKVRYKWAN
ncbi:ImmA/IrrE family metallo-endopeptidase [Vibrio vulnificus]|nr:ImmA/IrrE family metallo-endopeptidase [Vibrio vulnificus]EHZ2754302.1 ImmA/IrrE family metallo-endopeptidase [Vibrio vulnificus]EKD8802609.1 ImmA/IrrE family metallo-endopeptidase [Vibrio vulnificus]EKD9321629.1 ImmA/IrrE family metallo-endopeptidase [Vibrio vulnificus]EME0152900.1 ImmA/IrrE family metallo-endopeptidase [Vibrio vulnificus]